MHGVPQNENAHVKKIGVNVKVPRDAEYGHSVLLRCTWSLPRNNSTLYSVKWYKDEYEFFSYMPDNEPDTRIKTYPQRGVHIDVRSSNKTAVRLTQLTLNSTGQYKCEVSTGAPYYATNYAMDNLTVIVLPNHEPEITGLGSQYAVGENLTANCTAWPSVPKAVITWVINGVEAPAHQVIEYPARRDEVPVTYTGIPSILGLRMDVSSSHLTRNQGTLTVVCRAPVGSRKFEALKRVRVTHANNQRLSAGDLRSAGFAARAAPLVIAVLLVALTT
ncbi:V-set and immunoglobulin domain-containing protein 2-like [Copidosoma floridanum]|uniref:V-set and immunoglobulin domain-containing protein 2-like n=1 Tax=Copidosoma floridanum TaxID=29053 RepID=UPI0006C97F76|nr:V-set and immunoglobulin domain-containing protein 2-like [Copidosoma floridanum]